jgi:hypothetical protein
MFQVEGAEDPEREKFRVNGHQYEKFSLDVLDMFAEKPIKKGQSAFYLDDNAEDVHRAEQECKGEGIEVILS